MILGKPVWRFALGITVMCSAACSDDNPASMQGNPIATAGVSGAGSSGGALPTSGGAPTATGGVGQAAAGSSGAASATVGIGGASTTGGSGGSAGASAAGSSAPIAGSGGAAGAPDPGVACNPAEKKPDPVKAMYTQIPGYDRLSKEPTTGPAKAILEEDPGLPDWTVYRPETLGGEQKHPILIWANGGCLTNGTLYGQWLLELASHGYVAIADGKPLASGASPGSGGMRSGGDGDPMLKALDWLEAENARPCSQYYHKLDVTKVGVAGQSCGGLMALSAGGDERITTTVVCNSGLFAADQSIYSALHSPVAYLIGGSADIAYSNAERDFMNISNVPIFYGNLEVGHGGTWGQTNGGEMGRVGLAWLDWQLKGDAAAQKMFVGADCELCKSPSEWTVEKKMID